MPILTADVKEEYAGSKGTTYIVGRYVQIHGRD